MLYKEDWDKCKDRFTAYWEGEILDRCCISVTAPRNKPMDSMNELRDARDLIEKWTNSEYRMERLLHNVSNTFYGGEAFPNEWVNLGPGVMAAFLGSSYGLADSTVWFDRDPMIKDWDKKPKFTYREDTELWNIYIGLLEKFLEASKDNFMVGVTDLGGNFDIAGSLRGTEVLLYDLLDSPDEVKKLIAQIDQLWFKYYDRIQTLISKYAEGSSAWMGLWCKDRWYPLQCDFSAMISPKMFEEFVSPSLTREAAFLDKSIYHLDGPGELPHLDHILDIDRINGIQWQPGAGQPNMGDPKWYPVLKKIQAKGKNLVIDWIDPDQIEKLLQNISPKGVFISTHCKTEDEAKDLIKAVEKWSRK